MPGLAPLSALSFDMQVARLGMEWDDFIRKAEEKKHPQRGKGRYRR
jgi:hypothetical protein